MWCMRGLVPRSDELFWKYSIFNAIYHYSFTPKNTYNLAHKWMYTDDNIHIYMYNIYINIHNTEQCKFDYRKIIITSFTLT